MSIVKHKNSPTSKSELSIGFLMDRMPTEELLSTYGISTPKKLLDKTTITESIIPALENGSEQLAVSTIYGAMTAAIECVSGTVGIYFPSASSAVIENMLDAAIKNISGNTYAELLSGKYCDTLTESIDYVIKELSRNRLKKPAFADPVIEAFKSFKNVSRCDVHAGAGHMIANTSDNNAVTLGNMCMKIVNPAMQINVMTEDYRAVCYSDMYNSSVIKAVDSINTAAKQTLLEVSTGGNHQHEIDSLINGAAIECSTIKNNIKQYLSEVIRICDNFKHITEEFAVNNQDLTCFITSNTVTENYVPNVSNDAFGWIHESIVTGKEIYPKLEGILNLPTHLIEAISDRHVLEDITVEKIAKTDSDRNVYKDYDVNYDEPLHITGNNIQYVLGAVSLEKNPHKREVIAEKLAECICNTIKWENAHENYSDIPVMTLIDESLLIAKTLTEGTELYTAITEAESIILYKIAHEEAGAIVHGTFNAAPTIDEITPMPVETRACQMAYNKICRAETDEELDKAMFEFAQLGAALESKLGNDMNDKSEQYSHEGINYIDESSKVGKAARSVSRKVQAKTARNIRKQGGAIHQVKQAVHNAVDPMEKYIKQMYEKVKKADSDERRKILTTGGVAPKILRWLKRAIPISVGAAVGTVIPVAAVISGIALIGFIATDKMLDEKEKRKILRELEDEIQIVNEKIDDSRGDNNKQKKYELMRIRNELKRVQARIRYGLKE